MNNSTVVGELKGVTQRRHDFERLFGREHSVSQEMAEVYAVNKFHQQEIISARLAEIVNCHDVRMVQRGERLGFPRETGGEFCVAHAFGSEELKGDEAVQIGQKAAAMQPDNSETLGNLACAYLIAAKIPEAVATIQAAMALNADDRINLRIQAMINEVATGKRPQPRCLGDLTRPSKPSQMPPAPPRSKSLWERLQFWK